MALDASGAQAVKLFGTDMPKLGVLNINNMHDTEHYGNLAVYMRINVPPRGRHLRGSKC